MLALVAQSLVLSPRYLLVPEASANVFGVLAHRPPMIRSDYFDPISRKTAVSLHDVSLHDVSLHGVSLHDQSGDERSDDLLVAVGLSHLRRDLVFDLLLGVAP